MDFLGYKLTVSLPSFFPEAKLIVNTINPHSYCVAKEDIQFQKALKNSHILVPDGVGVILANRFLYNRRIEKISGYDLHLHFLEVLQKNGGGKVFYLGSSDQTLQLIALRVKNEFPLIEVMFLSPPFKKDFDLEENLEIVNNINHFDPDVLFVGMTAPKQENWVYENKGDINAKVICSIGAVFDFYAGTVKRPSQFWISLGLEWLPRFLKEPKRLWRRNLISTPKFIFHVVMAKIRGTQP
jgi:N-acetylglucosaminyldiphosphoundecaprenol N-acetyl-beta-D-mannosaminyltransferase